MLEEDCYFLENMAVGPLQINCYLFGCSQTKKAVIIDPGDEPEVIVAAVENHHAEVEAILLTHGHYDHLGALTEIKSIYDCPILIHPQDQEALTNPEINLSIFTGESLVCPAADRLIEEGDTVAVGKLSLRVLHTPGHSVGSVCFVYERIVFGGDLLFLMNIGRPDLPGGSFDILKESIQTKIYTMPDETIIYPGHGDKTTVGFEKKHNSFVRAQ